MDGLVIDWNMVKRGKIKGLPRVTNGDIIDLYNNSNINTMNRMALSSHDYSGSELVDFNYEYTTLVGRILATHKYTIDELGLDTNWIKWRDFYHKNPGMMVLEIHGSRLVEDGLLDIDKFSTRQISWLN